MLRSGPSETAGVVAAENVEGRVVRVGPQGANHFHEHGIGILFLGDAWVTHCIGDIGEKYRNGGLPVII